MSERMDDLVRWVFDQFGRHDKWPTVEELRAEASRRGIGPEVKLCPTTGSAMCAEPDCYRDRADGSDLCPAHLMDRDGP